MLFGLILVFAVVGWVVHFTRGIIEDWRLREGNHCFMSYSVCDDVVAKKIVKVMDSCVISQAVVTFAISGAVVFGFGNKKYAAEFKRSNSAARYGSALPPVVRF